MPEYSFTPDWFLQVCSAVSTLEFAPHPMECAEWEEDGCNCGLGDALERLYPLVGADIEGRVGDSHPLRHLRLAGASRA